MDHIHPKLSSLPLQAVTSQKEGAPHTEDILCSGPETFGTFHRRFEELTICLAQENVSIGLHQVLLPRIMSNRSGSFNWLFALGVRLYLYPQ
jgi:hypothetical protein